MDTVIVSPKFQIVIPKEIRQDLGLKPGKKMVVIEKQGTIHLIPVNSISSVRGIAKGISTRGIRDETERFD
ncbi:MAG: AbrB/MazE/SpoVT family DNA-binding domain-containing protein [Candidatus Aenigmarchaeota archaeon]|nr:AbrB/MazE/SpoVT family DNA-binding domain-containing protein [Candidatus Aenigmarchaeota archaeon]